MSLSFCSVCGRPLRGDSCSLCFNRAQSNALKRQRHSTLTGAVVARKQPVVVDETVADEVVPDVKSVPVKSVRDTSSDFYRQIKEIADAKAKAKAATTAAATGKELEVTFSDPAADETTVVSGVDDDDDDEVSFGSDAAAEPSYAGVSGDDDPPMKLRADNLSSLFPLPMNEEADSAFDQGLDEIDEL